MLESEDELRATISLLQDEIMDLTRQLKLAEDEIDWLTQKHNLCECQNDD